MLESSEKDQGRISDTILANDKVLLHKYIEGPEGISENNKIKILELIISGKADINMKDDAEQTPLQFLMNNLRNYFWIYHALFLITYGADPDTKDKHGKSILHYLVLNNYQSDGIFGIMEHLKEPIARLITKYNADVNIQDETNQTPLQNLMNQQNWRTQDALLLVNYGADPDTKSAFGRSLLHRLVACYEDGLPDSNKEEIIYLVTIHKAKINIQDTQGITPLQVLIEKQNFNAKDALLLVQLGADPNSCNSKGETLLFLLTRSESMFTLISKALYGDEDIHIIYELIVKYGAQVDQNTLLDTKRRHLIAKKLFEAWLDPDVEHKHTIAIVLQQVRADFKFAQNQVVEVVKEKGLTDMVSTFFINPIKELTSTSHDYADITLDYYVNSLLLVDYNRNQDEMIFQYVELMVKLANLNPESFVNLFTEELSFMTVKNNIKGVILRAPYLRALIASSEMSTFVHFNECHKAVYNTFKEAGLLRIEPLQLEPSSDTELQNLSLDSSNPNEKEKNSPEAGASSGSILTSFTNTLNVGTNIVGSFYGSTSSQFMSRFGFSTQKKPSGSENENDTEDNTQDTLNNM